MHTVAALAIFKVGPRAYHFRSGPTTRPGGQKSKISVVHNLVILKGHPECLKCGKALWESPLAPLGEFTALPRSLSWWGGIGCPFPKNPTPLSAIRASNLTPSGLAPCLPKSVYQNSPV